MKIILKEKNKYLLWFNRNEEAIEGLRDFCFSDSEMKPVAGHFKKITVLAACEIFFEKMDGRAEREYDEKTGLNLLK